MSLAYKAARSSVSSSNVSDNDDPFNPYSKWTEPKRFDRLTLWEFHRKPRKLVKKNRKIRCPLTMLNAQFRCAICLGYLKDTTIVMECLHRFCGECINKCVRLGMKDCPSCRKFIPSRRSLRRDYDFDRLVTNILGTPEDRQHHGQPDPGKLIHLQRAIDTKKRQMEAAIDKQKQNSGGAGDSSLSSSKQNQQSMTTTDAQLNNNNGKPAMKLPSTTTIQNLEPSPLIDLELRRHPREDQVDRLERPFLTVNGDAKVSLMKSFLSQKLEPRDYEISVKQKDDVSVVLNDDLSLSEVKDSLFSDSMQVIVIKYRVAKKDEDATVSNNK